MKIENRDVGSLKRRISPSVKKGVKQPTALKVLPEKVISGKALLDRQLYKLENTLKSLKIPKGHILERGLPPLKQILNLLSHPSLQLSGSESEVMLMEKFLTSWLGKYGDGLPGNGKKELTALINVVKSLQLSAMETDDQTFYSLSGAEPGENQSWRLSFSEERQSSPEGEDSDVNCLMEMETENLGSMNIVLSQKKRGAECLFLCSEEKTGKEIGNNLDKFRTQLENHGVEIPLIKVGRAATSEEKASNPGNKREVDLWG